MPSSVDYMWAELTWFFHKSAVGITNMILAAACYPETQRRVQEELDKVVGENRSKSQCTASHECLTMLH